MNSPLSANTPPFDLSGQTLGNYRLLHRLGRGGMADVYLAEQPSLQRQVAIKVLRAELASQADYVKRFHNEARAVAALVHANIVQIYEVGCVDGVHFIAQEYVPGQNLKQLVSRTGALDVRRALSIARQIAAALNKASQRNIVHRDIKPENILLTPQAEVKVADFGLARVMDPGQTDLTHAGLTMGTPLYMSPEQVEGRPLDPRSDLYSLGATLFFMFVGRPPFQGDTPLSVAVQHLQNAPPDLASLRPDVPPAAREIVQRLLSKKPSERYPNAGELLRDLREVVHHLTPGEMSAVDSGEWTIGQTVHGTLDATRQLQAVMATQAMTIPRRPAWRRDALLLATAVALGGLVAHVTWRGPLLQSSSPSINGADHKATPLEQYWYAVMEGTEAAYKSVTEYFPPDSEHPQNLHYGRRAQQQLAHLYLNHEQYDQALLIFEEFANLAPQEREYRAFGLAGQIVVFDRLNDQAKVKSLLSQAVNVPRDLKDRDIEELFDKIIARVQQNSRNG